MSFIEKTIDSSIDSMSEIIPGYKTRIAMWGIFGMFICEMSGLIFDFGHSFDGSTWAMVPLTPTMTIMLRKYREMKESENMKNKENKE